jgi:hypothetical protein
MSAGQHPEDLASKAAEAVRAIVADAEDRATEIIREAEAKAASIREQAEADAGEVRERAEADARERIEAAKRALDELGGSLAAAVSEATQRAESEPQPIETEEEPAESAGAPEAPISPPSEETASAEAETANGDDAAERLIAMKLAVEGKDPAAIEAELIERFGPGDRSALLRDVISRAAR